MTVSLKHQFTSNVADSLDATLVQPSNWNAEHTLTAGADALLGTVTAGAVTEITCTAAGRAILDDADAAAQRATLAAAGTGVTNTFTASQIISVTDNSNAALRVTQLGTGNALVVEDSTNPDSTPFVVDASGNVGVGAASTGSKLEVLGPSGVTSFTGTSRLGALVRGSSSTDDYSGVDFTGASGSTPYARIAMLTSGSGSLLQFGTSNSYGSGVTNTSLTINPSGNVGVGTTAPLQRLTVANTSITGGGPATSGSAADPNAGMRVVLGSIALDTGVYSSGDTWLQARAASDYSLKYGLSINPTGGDVSIGAGIPGDIRLSVYKNTNSVVFRAFATAGTYTNEVAQLISSRASGTDFKFLGCFVSDGASYALQIRGDGNVYNVNNVYAAISDKRLKDNIVDTSPKLDDLMQVQVRNYNLIGSDLKQIGVVAQEIEQVFPGLVEETEDKDAGGNPLGTTTKSVKYSVFIPILIKAVQELSAKVDAQAAEISDLKTRLTAIGN